MRPAKALLAALAGLLLLAVGAAAVVPRWLDWDQYRDSIAALASAGLGRPVGIAGPIRLVLLPHARLVASDVTLDDPGDGLGATVAAMRLRVGLAALLSGRIEVEELLLQGADIRLPWPPAPGIVGARPPTWLTSLHARLEAARLHVGALDVRGIDGEVAVDAQTGALSANGSAEMLGRRWRISGRLGRPGNDGSATVTLAVDGQGPVLDTGGTLSGQLAADGTLSGRVAARGPDLSLLLAAPAQPWRAEGRLTTGGGLAVADDLDVQVGTTPARGAVAMRLLPAARLDVALAASRIDGDAWLAPLLRGSATALPTGIDLSAEAASVGGGTVRRLRAGFDLSPDGVGVREAEAILPGDATVHLSGRVAAGRFVGSGTLDAPDLAETLRWLRPRAPALLAALPPGAFRTASLAAGVTADASTLVLGGVQGKLDGTTVAGDVAVHGGDRPAVAITAALADIVLDPWVPDRVATSPAALTAMLGGVAARFGGFDADLSLKLTHPVLRGRVLDGAGLEARAQDGTLALQSASLAGDDLVGSLAGTVAPGGHVTDGRLDVSTLHAAVAIPFLPGLQGLLHGPAALHVSASGDPAALAVALSVDVADAQLRLSGRADLPGRRWSGSISLHHPGAPRLLGQLGLPGTAAWLGDGSFSLQGQFEASPDGGAAHGLELSAGSLRTAADLTLTGLGAGHPELAGRVAAEAIALPLPYAYSPDPWPLGALMGWGAQVDVKAGRVLIGQSPALEQASAALTLAGGALRVDKLVASVAGGQLAGQVSLDAANPPHLAVRGTVTNATVAGPLLEAPIDLAAGHLGAAVRLDGTGFSPVAMLATLSGTAWLSVRDGVLAGFDAPGALAASAGPDPSAIPGAVTAELAGGSTPFTALEAAATLDRGTATVTAGTLTVRGGSAVLSGTVDLPGNAVDLRVALRRADDAAPAFGLRVIGPVGDPRRTPDLADLARYLATQ